MRRTHILIAIILMGVLPHFVRGQEESSILGPSRVLRESLSKFTAEGTFYKEWIDFPIEIDLSKEEEGFVLAYTAGKKSVQGNFRWIKDGSRFLFEIFPTETTGVTDMQLRNSYHPENILVCDGEMQVIFCRAPYFVTGCKAHAFSSERGGYGMFCSFVPYLIRPERGADCFVPEELFAAKLESQDGDQWAGLSFVHENDELPISTIYHISRDSLYAGFSRVLENGQTIVSASMELSEAKVPHVLQMTSYTAEGTVQAEESVVFDSFLLDQVPDDISFSLSDINWCKNSRIVKLETGVPDLIVRSENGFESNGKSIRETLVEHERLNSEQRSTTSRPISTYFIWLVAALLFLSAGLLLHRRSTS